MAAAAVALFTVGRLVVPEGDPAPPGEAAGSEGGAPSGGGGSIGGSAVAEFGPGGTDGTADVPTDEVHRPAPPATAPVRDLVTALEAGRREQSPPAVAPGEANAGRTEPAARPARQPERRLDPPPAAPPAPEPAPEAPPVEAPAFDEGSARRTIAEIVERQRHATESENLQLLLADAAPQLAGKWTPAFRDMTGAVSDISSRIRNVRIEFDDPTHAQVSFRTTISARRDSDGRRVEIFDGTVRWRLTRIDGRWLITWSSG